MSQTDTSKRKNKISPREHGVEVTLDPEFLLKHALYMPDGETIVKSNMTLGQAIEAIALAHVKAKLPHLAGKCACATIKFKDGKFEVSFGESIDNLPEFLMSERLQSTNLWIDLQTNRPRQK
jgi:hypothetical protein